MKALRAEDVSSWFIGRYEYGFTSNVAGLVSTITKEICAVLNIYSSSPENV
jgi:hypothetical protein